MNITLIRPPKISGAFEKILIQEPINLAYIAAYLKSKGFGVNIWDFEVEAYSEENLRQRLIREDISIAGITSMSPTIYNAHTVASALKKNNPKIQVIAGGPHVSALPEESLAEFPSFDYIIAGEGEIPMSRLCEKINAAAPPPYDIAGLAYRDGQKIMLNELADYIQDLDNLPFPDRTLFKSRLYRHIYAAGINLSGKKSTVVFTSRGCPLQCTFCAVKKTLGGKVRFRSAENVLEEIRQCKEFFAYNHITFEDTNLSLNRDNFLKICYGLKSLRLTWDCQTRVSLVDKKLIRTMADCGCLKIAYGVESGSQRILQLMKKNITITQIKNAFYWTRQANIIACAFFILGSHPEENKEDIQKTEQLLHKIKPDVFQLGIICPYPGTEVYSIMKKERIIDNIDWSKLNFMHSHPNWGTKHLSASQLIAFQKKIYLRYLLSPVFLFSVFKKILNPIQILHLLRLSLYMLKYLLFEKRR